ncbi:hypothetical protein PanWU01x14_171450 [Parasponia andersonii]|uniref:Uncharacterized protein n=1 Tax=Parasponia andersonii TaxID=3476 RepID=A0A2P5C9S8_PARAD|nr:hypothetical protein PanWU01x14_171450 [Parasponia andersonii]
MGWFRLSTVLAVVIMADLMAAGLQSGWADLSRAAAPPTWGQAIDVPDRMLNSVFRVSESNPVGPIASVHAARMLTPGAIKSGLRISGLSVLGPLPEKEATIGAGLIPITVPWKSMVAVGLLSDDT